LARARCKQFGLAIFRMTRQTASFEHFGVRPQEAVYRALRAEVVTFVEQLSNDWGTARSANRSLCKRARIVARSSSLN
jgi:hypothetical protein